MEAAKPAQSAPTAETQRKQKPASMQAKASAQTHA